MRKRATENEDTTIEDEVNISNQSDTRLQQGLRGKDVGASLDTLAKKKSVVAIVPGEVKTVENVLGSQFSAQSDSGDHSTHLPHEKMMEKFIDEQLGLNKPKRFGVTAFKMENVMMQ